MNSLAAVGLLLTRRRLSDEDPPAGDRPNHQPKEERYAGGQRSPAKESTAFNLRPAGGGGVFEHPHLRFFADSKKTAARSAAGFSPTLSPIFLATFVKVSILGHARSGHQVRSSDHTLQKIYNRAPATVFEGQL